MAFAAVVSFMGLGLVDPILPAIAKNLHASPSQVELLFTSYFAFTGSSMLVSGVVASRIGAKRTLLAGPERFRGGTPSGIPMVYAWQGRMWTQTYHLVKQLGELSWLPPGVPQYEK